LDSRVAFSFKARSGYFFENYTTLPETGKYQPVKQARRESG
jgi:hypothetical protein